MSNWVFDPLTALITALVLPLLYLLRNIILNNLKGLTSYLAEGIMYWLSRSVKHSLAGALTLKRYCRLQLGNEKYLYLQVPSTTEITLNIDQVFVPLTIERLGTKEKTYNQYDILTVGNRIRIIGDPGSGKTSLIKRIFRDACISALVKPSKHQLPILIELKKLTPPKESKYGAWLYELLRNEALESAVYQMEECFDNYVTTAGILVLLDGLDEVPSNFYDDVHQEINSLSEKLNRLSENNIIVLTMRTQFHDQVSHHFRDNFPHAVSLKPFTPSEIYEFLTRWPFKKDVQKNISKVYKELTDRPTLRELCGNPLILAMYVAEYLSGGLGIAPDSRTEFYKKITEELIIKRRLRQEISTVARTKIREQREEILGRLAYQHMIDSNQPANTLLWSDALTIVKEVMKCDEIESEKYFLEIAKETGLITEERPRETFRFIHLTFCEFLAAYEAIEGRENGWKQLFNTHISFCNSDIAHIRSRLREVIPFATGLLPRVKRYDAVKDLFALNDEDLLALGFLETKFYDVIEWVDFSNSMKESLLSTPERNWDDQWLRKLHIFNVVIRDAELCSSHKRAKDISHKSGSIFQELIIKQKDSLTKLLSAYAAQDAAAAFRVAELCNLDLAKDFPNIIISNCDQTPFLGLAIEQMIQEPMRLGLWSILLSEAGLESRAVAKMLHSRKPSKVLEDKINTLPSKQIWFCPGLLRKSFYTQSLSIASSISDNISEMPFLQIIKKIAPPSTKHWLSFFFKKSNNIIIYSIVMYAILIIIFTYFEKKFGIKKSASTLLYEMLIMSSIVVISYILIIIRIGYRSLFNSIINLRAIHDDPSPKFMIKIALGAISKKYKSSLNDIEQMRKVGTIIR